MSSRESWALLREPVARSGLRTRLAFPAGPRDPQSKQEREATRTCMREHRDSWVVVQRECNYSAFSGYHRTPSAYSGIRCKKCDRYWRTRAAYVSGLPDAEYGVI
jgi:hypothetical protein